MAVIRLGVPHRCRRRLQRWTRLPFMGVAGCLRLRWWIPLRTKFVRSCEKEGRGLSEKFRLNL
jgi:hypothetical protein